MEATMKKYAERIIRNDVDPHVRDDGRIDGLLLDPTRDEVPLELLGFGIYRLRSDFAASETKDREMVLVPQDGAYEVVVNGRKFTGERRGGPFAPGPGRSNASAVYVPRGAALSIRGQGDMAFFSAPALQDREPYQMTSREVQVVSRGEWVWRRDVASLISPQDASSNLVVGETYSPPGLWSGTPLHRHDGAEGVSDESDHEEVYYHRFQWQKRPGDQFGAYGVQLLMDGQRLMKAFVISDRSVIAIPGGCHPVVASPISELLYLWGLAGSRHELKMKDITEFAYLKMFEGVFQKLDQEGTAKRVSAERFRDLCRSFSGEEAKLLAVMLKEKGYVIE